tara:strand:- start:3083 stop:3376 length:294 start_codon:yes stop_codon:yes gene_type:complete
MTKITKEDLLNVANLARLHISEEEAPKFANQLEKIITYVEQLEEVNTCDIQAMTRAVEVFNVTRSDDNINFKERENLLNLGPQREGDFFKVPKILSE